MLRYTLCYVSTIHYFSGGKSAVESPVGYSHWHWCLLVETLSSNGRISQLGANACLVQ